MADRKMKDEIKEVVRSKVRPRGVELPGVVVDTLYELYDRGGSMGAVAERLGVSKSTVKKYLDMREMDRRGGGRLDRDVRGLGREAGVMGGDIGEVYDMARDRVVEGKVGMMEGLGEEELVKALPKMLDNWKEEMFCRYYVRHESMANGSEAYMKAFELANDMYGREQAKVGAYRLLQQRHILKRIHDLLDLSGLNMEYVSKELVFCITQNADLKVKIKAIEVAAKLLTRTEKGSQESAMVMNQQLNIYLGIGLDETGRNLTRK